MASRELARRLAAAVRLHAVPVEGVVPDLGGVVEDAALGVLDDLLEALVRLGLPSTSLFRLVT